MLGWPVQTYYRTTPARPQAAPGASVILSMVKKRLTAPYTRLVRRFQIEIEIEIAIGIEHHGLGNEKLVDPDFDSDCDPEEEKPQQSGGGDGIQPLHR